MALMKVCDQVIASPVRFNKSSSAAASCRGDSARWGSYAKGGVVIVEVKREA